jgi:hypothetical protein
MGKKRFELYPYTGHDVPGKDKTLENIRSGRYPDWAVKVSEIDTSDPASPFYSEAENDERFAAYRALAWEIEFGSMTPAEASEYEVLCQKHGKVPMTENEVSERDGLFHEQLDCNAKGEHLPDECSECHKEYARSSFQVYGVRRCDDCPEVPGEGRPFLVPRKQMRLNVLAQLPTEADLQRRGVLAAKLPDPKMVPMTKLQEHGALAVYCRRKGFIV